MRNAYLLITLMLAPILLTAAAMFNEIIILPDFGGACSIGGADFDDDGDTDFVVTSSDDGCISWFENDGCQNFIEHSICDNLDGARVLDVADFEGDGDEDVCACAFTDGKISWFENDGLGNFTEKIITADWSHASNIYAKDHFNDIELDIDGDGDTDVVATACASNCVAWFENDGNEIFTRHTLKEDWYRANSVTATDLDLDGDMDVLATAKAGEIIWFENDGNQNFTEHIIFTEWDSPNSIQALDIDQDGDIDVAATSCSTSNSIGWLENDGDNNFTLHLLKDNCSGARGITLSDIDADADVDIFAIGWNEPTSDAFFFENDGEQNFTEHVFCPSAFDLLDLFMIDVDGDEDLDILGSCYGQNELRWWENLDYFLLPDFNADQLSGHAPVTTNFLEVSYSLPDVNSWSWDFDYNGIIDSNEENPTWVYEEPGYYTVSLEVTNGILSETLIREEYIRVFDGESSMEFDGSSGYCTCQPDTSLNLTEHFTWEAWIYPLEWGEADFYGGTIFDKTAIKIFLCRHHNTLNDHSLMLKIITEGSSLCFACTPENSIELQQWNHIAVSYNGSSSEIKIYINAVIQELTFLLSPSGNIVDNSMSEIYLGNGPGDGNTFEGIIDEGRLWNLVLSAGEISDHMSQYLAGDESGLVAYWQMNEGWGDEITDMSVNNNILAVWGGLWAQGIHLESSGISGSNVIPNADLTLINYPNPFNPDTQIAYNLFKDSFVKIAVFNVKGQRIRILENTFQDAGPHLLLWDGKDNWGRSVESGVYFLKLEQAQGSFSRKMLLLK
ncbi:MAG: VCBS repeat-containing protein [Candidatus Cloacimonetes bacterium]|nr:VCBS repeat-containing protein [Candidatus Cloacimonadota bacterium]